MNVNGLRLAFWLLGAIIGKVFVSFLSADWIRLLFCAIPAHLAAGYYGVHVSFPELCFRTHGVSLAVVPSCGGTDFFVLCAALLAVRLWSCRRAFVFFAFPVAYVLTLTLNSLRLIALVPIEQVFPKSEMPIVHLGIGVIFFLPVICLLWYTLFRKGSSDGNA